jgi:hypothetical protein
MVPLIVSVAVSAFLLGAHDGNSGSGLYDYSVNITNDTSTPLDAIHFYIDDATPDASSLRENWQFDTLSGVDYWSLAVANDLQPTDSTVLRFATGRFDSIDFTATYFDPVTFDQFDDSGTMLVHVAPEPGSVGCLGLGCVWLLGGRRKRAWRRVA